jgi:hypothetical protein
VNASRTRDSFRPTRPLLGAHAGTARSRVAAFSLVLCAALWVAGCGGSSGATSGGNTPPAGTATVAHTAKAPTLTDSASCEKLMSLSEANQIMGATATTIRVVASDEEDGGSCNYETQPFHATVFVAFFASAGVSLQAASAAITGNPKFAGTTSAVTGVGDQALFIVNPIPGTSITQYHLMVTVGTLLMDTVIPSSQPDNNTALSRLKQVAQLVLSRA